ncbi:MAG: MBL fold metallo-hydrolase [Lentisphaeria bacterium]
MNTNIIKISPNILVRNSIDNTAIIDTGQFLVIIDTLENPLLFNEISELIGSFNKPLRYIINTHNHPDHTALNHFLSEKFHAEIVNFQSNITHISGSNLSIELIRLPLVHTNNDLIVHIPQHSFLACGDVFGWGLIPYEAPLNHNIWQNIISAYDLMININPQSIMPGHGPILSSKEIHICKNYFCHLMKMREKTPDQLKSFPPPENMKNWWRFTQWKHQFSIKQMTSFQLK